MKMSGEDPSGWADVKYANGIQAILMKNDGSGFIYYPSGRVAVCINKELGYTGTSFFYEDDKRSTLLCYFDVHAVGFALCNLGRKSCRAPNCKCDGYQQSVHQVREHAQLVHCRKCVHVEAEHSSGDKLVAGKKLLKLLDENGNVARHWVWETALSEPLEIKLNRSMRFTLYNRQHMEVTFRNEEIERTFEVGQRFKRTDSYLDKSRSDGLGRLEIDLNSTKYPSLRDRQSLLGTKQARTLTADLFQHAELGQFVGAMDTMTRGIKKGNWGVKPYFEKPNRLAQSLPNLGRPGSTHGSVASRNASRSRLDLSSSASATNLASTMQFLNESIQGAATLKRMSTVEIKEQVNRLNPALSRSSILTCSSGRYSAEIPLPAHLHPSLRKLDTVTHKQLDAYLSSSNVADKLVVLCCLASWHPQCRQAEQFLEVVNAELHDRQKRSSETCSFILVKTDASESRLLVERYNLHCLPMYLMFYNGRLVYADTMGGQSVKLLYAMDTRPRVLLLEHSAKDQLQAEKVLRRTGLQWDLASSVKDALTLVRHQSYGLVLACHPLSDVELAPLLYALQSQGRGGTSVAIISMLPLGYPVPQPPSTSTGSIITDFIAKPLRQHRLEALMSRWKDTTHKRERESHIGLTRESFLSQLESSLRDGQRGVFLPASFKFGHKLTVELGCEQLKKHLSNFGLQS
eukprot:GILK01004672.1.p1 GENE.GILK01004672.1~~GILK01004672.1.p1  ORF type:complete len:687 (-),score=94.37 GILK01004672.1:76-2136(-)